MDDNHVLLQQVANDLWFRQMDYVRNAQENMFRKNLISSEEDLMALALRTKPHTNSWLYLSPRVCTLGEDTFEHAPAVNEEIHVYLKNLLNEQELAGGKMLQLMQDVITMSIDRFQTDISPQRHNTKDLTQFWEEWEWDGGHSSCPCATRGPPAT